MDVTDSTVYLLTKEDKTIIKATDKKEDIIDEAVDYIKNNGGEPVAYKITEDDVSPVPWKDIALRLAEQS